MAKLGVDLASRFLFAWPHPPPYRPLAGRKARGATKAFAALRRLAQVPGTAGAPTILQVEEKAVPALDAFLAKLHPRSPRPRVGAGMAGKGPRHRRAADRLPGAARRSVAAGPRRGQHLVGRTRVMERGNALWTDYLRPHARAVLQLATPDDIDRKARHVLRWLRGRGALEVSREDPLRRAGAQRQRCRRRTRPSAPAVRGLREAASLFDAVARRPTAEPMAGQSAPERCRKRRKPRKPPDGPLENSISPPAGTQIFGLQCFMPRLQHRRIPPHL